MAPRCRPAPAPASGGGPLGAELGLVLGGGRRRLCSMEVPDCYARTSPVSLVGLACCRGAKCKARPRGTPPDGRYSHRAPCLRLRGPAAALPPGPHCGPASVAPGPPCLRGPGVALPPWPGRPASVAGPPCLRGPGAALLRGPGAALPPWPGRPACSVAGPPCLRGRAALPPWPGRPASGSVAGPPCLRGLAALPPGPRCRPAPAGGDPPSSSLGHSRRSDGRRCPAVTSDGGVCSVCSRRARLTRLLGDGDWCRGVLLV